MKWVEIERKKKSRTRTHTYMHATQYTWIVTKNNIEFISFVDRSNDSAEKGEAVNEWIADSRIRWRQERFKY